MQRDLGVEINLPYSETQVWYALTDADALAEWLMPVEDFTLEVGHQFRVRAQAMPGWDGIVNCEFLEIDEPHKLTYSWQGSKMRSSTTVTWTLTPLQDGGTRLRLDHQGFQGPGGALLAFMHRSGWRKMLNVRLTRHLGMARAA